MLCPAPSCIPASAWHVRQSALDCAMLRVGVATSADAKTASVKKETIFILAPAIPAASACSGERIQRFSTAPRISARSCLVRFLFLKRVNKCGHILDLGISQLVLVSGHLPFAIRRRSDELSVRRLQHL